MAVPIVDVNIVGVVLAAIAAFIVGMAWYSPMLFGNQWSKELGWTEKQMKEMKKKGASKMGKAYATHFIGGVLMAYVLAHVIGFATDGYAQVMDGVVSGFWMWLGFVVPLLSGAVLWEGRSKKYYMINVGYYLVSLVVMGAIIAWWA